MITFAHCQAVTREQTFFPIKCKIANGQSSKKPQSSKVKLLFFILYCLQIFLHVGAIWQKKSQNLELFAFVDEF